MKQPKQCVRRREACLRQLQQELLLRELRTLGTESNSQLINKANNFEWFSLVLEELTDVTNTTQQFIQGVSDKFEVTEATVRKDIFQ